MLPNDFHVLDFHVLDFHVLVQPGWHNSTAEHWQSYFERQIGDGASRIQHRDWDWPQLTEWIAEAREAIFAQSKPCLMVGHSVGSILVAHLATDPEVAAKIAGSLLVAPADIERPGAPVELASFRPIPMLPLPFPTVVAASSDDPYCAFRRAEEFASAWQATLVNLGPVGHVTAGTGYGPWEQGLQLLVDLAQAASEKTNAVSPGEER